MRLRAIAWTGVFTTCLLASFGASADRGPSESVEAATRAGESRAWLFRGMPQGVRAEATPGFARARAIIDALRPDARSLELTRVDAAKVGGDLVVRFEQTHRGLPVVGRGASVAFDAAGNAKLTVVRVEDDLPTSTVPRVAASDAARAAQSHVAFALRESDAYLVVWTGHDSPRLAWVVLPRVPAGFATAPRVIVDADTGRVIEVRDLVVFAKANVHETNPIASPNLKMSELPIAPDGGKLENAFIKTQNCIDKKSVRDVNFFGFALKLHICDLDQLATPDAGGDFSAVPTDEPGKPESRSDVYSEISMYYHASKAYAFFRGLAGDANAQVVTEKPLRTIANLQIADGIAQQDFTKASNPDIPLQPFQNAFYSPSGGGTGQIFEQLYGFNDGAMWFGQGPKRDYAYDGDVVYHEFGHGVVNATLRLGAWHLDKRGAIDSPGAMNEGLADYFSSAITGDPKVGEYASKDISASLDVIRTLDNVDKCPGAVAGEVHFDSTLFSGAMWEARTKIAAADQAKFDAAIYKAMRTHVGEGDLGFEDLAKLFVTQLTADFPAGATALDAAMKARGVTPGCERILEHTGAKVTAPPTGIGGFVSPGKQTLGSSGDMAPGIVQIHAKLPANTAKAKVTFSAKAQGGGGGGIFGGGGKPFAPVVVGKTGQAITWTTKGKLAHDGTAVDATAAGTTYTAVLDVPTDATDLYVQIANKGDSDGIYDGVSIATEPGPAPEQPTTPPSTTPPPGAKGSEDSSGCACRTTPATSTGGLALAGLGLAVGLLVARRRR